MANWLCVVSYGGVLDFVQQLRRNNGTTIWGETPNSIAINCQVDGMYLYVVGRPMGNPPNRFNVFKYRLRPPIMIKPNGRPDIETRFDNSRPKIEIPQRLLWSAYPVDSYLYGIAIDNAGSVYVCGDLAGEKNLWKLDKDGNLLASYNIGGGSAGRSLARDKEDNIFFGGSRTGSKSVWKLDGWSFDTGGNINGITTDKNGNVYATGIRVNNKTVWKLNSEGIEQWSANVGQGSDIAVDNEGNVCVCANSWNDKYAWEINNSGSIINSWGLAGQISRALAMEDNGDIYIALDGNVIHKIGRGTGDSWKNTVNCNLYMYGLTVTRKPIEIL